MDRDLPSDSGLPCWPALSMRIVAPPPPLNASENNRTESAESDGAPARLRRGPRWGQHGQARLSCPCGSVPLPPARLRHRDQPASRSHWDREQTQPPNAIQDRSEQLPGHGHFGHLERHIPHVVHDLGSDLDQLLPQRRQRPVLHLARQRQPPQEVPQVVGAARHSCSRPSRSPCSQPKSFLMYPSGMGSGWAAAPGSLSQHRRWPQRRDSTS